MSTLSCRLTLATQLEHVSTSAPTIATEVETESEHSRCVHSDESTQIPPVEAQFAFRRPPRPHQPSENAVSNATTATIPVAEQAQGTITYMDFDVSTDEV